MLNKDSQNSSLHQYKELAFLLKSRYPQFRQQLQPPDLLQGRTPMAESTRFAIDQIGPAPVGHAKQQPVPVPGYDEVVLVKGWAVDLESEEAAHRVVAKVDGHLFEAQLGFDRPDVAQALKGSDYLKSGWEVRVPRVVLPDGPHWLTLIILRKDQKSYYETKPVRFTMTGYNPWMERNGEEVVFQQPKEEVIRNLYRQLQSREDLINNMYTSWSWRLTAPLRTVFDGVLFVREFFHPRVISAGLRVLRQQGPLAFLQGLLQYFRLQFMGAGAVHTSVPDAAYQLFLSRNKVSPETVRERKAEAKALDFQPLISIITPVYNTEPKWLDLCVESVLNQYYPNWELCLHDDCSPNQDTVKTLQKWAKKDKRIKVSRGKENQHISGASNEAIRLASGDYIGLLDHDDELTPDALLEVVKRLNQDRELDVIYSDEDKLELNGSFSGPYFKPDFNKDLLLSNNYMCHFTVIRKTLGDRVGWFRKSYEGSQDYDLFLRLVEQTKHVEHIPKVLYHWRKIPGSTALVYDDKSYANQASIQALSDYLQRNRIEGAVENGLWPGSFRIKRTISGAPFVSIIIPFKDRLDLLKPCVESILERSTYSDYEVLLVNNRSEKEETLDYLKEVSEKYDAVQVLEYDEPFNFAAINNFAVDKAHGDVMLLLNNDTQVVSPDWLESMLEHAQREEVGAVGAKLLFPNDTVQHAGVLLGVGGLANHAFLNHHKDDNVYFGNSNVIRNYSACSAACLMVRKDDYLAVGGMEEELAVAYNDIDLCLKLQKHGLRIVYTPFAQLYHFESRTRGYERSEAQKKRLEKETNFMRERWGELLDHDPYYNPNLNRERPDFSLNLKD